MLINKFTVKPAYSGLGKKFEGHLDVDKKGNNVVVKDERSELQPIIDSYAESCKIKNIVARIQCGDYSALIGNRGEGSYIDEATAKTMINKDITEINKDLTSTYLRLYNNFAGKDNISYEKYCSLISQGKYSELEKFMPKKEVADNA